MGQLMRQSRIVALRAVEGLEMRHLHVIAAAVNGGLKACHWGGLKVGHLVPRLGA